MARARPPIDIGFGSDSFSDVVTNVVGILIILVIAVGIRARHAPVTDPPRAEPPAGLVKLRDEVARGARRRAAAVARGEELARRLAQLKRSQGSLADQLDERLSAVAAQTASREVHARQANDLGRQLAQAQAYLHRLETEEAAAASRQPEIVQIKTTPTPIGREVDVHETHFQLAGGRIVYIPLDELIERLRREAVQQLSALRELPEFSDVVGPIGGFRLRYTMRRVDLPLQRERDGPARRGSYAQLAQWTLIPERGALGETIEEARADGSRFHRAIERLDPQGDSITVWVYPDSFAEFRTLRQALYAQGFAVAARPLPQGRPISGSPEGSRSSAQ
jgi:hypothetical protein